MKKRTLFEKIWDNHLIVMEPDSPAVLYIDLHLLHEVTSPQAFEGLRSKGLSVRRPDLTIGTMDHSTPTVDLKLSSIDEAGKKQLEIFQSNCVEFGIPVLGLDHPNRGIVHVMGPELGLTQPGMTIVCGDSHTSTHGAFGALAFGIGTSEVEHVLVTQSLLQSQPKTMQVHFTGNLPFGVTAKDMILAVIREIGVGGGAGHVIEYTGEAVQDLDMEGRMTLCNMTIEAGARAGIIAPDEATFDYLRDKPHAPQGSDWDKAVSEWKKLKTDQGAEYDKIVQIDISGLAPMITYGTNPEMGIAINSNIPDPNFEKDLSKKTALKKALDYMDLKPGQAMIGQELDVVFIGSCTNGRITDLRDAAALLKNKRIASGLRMLVVPGSENVRKLAEEEGLDQIFISAGAEWRYSGCSMCLAMNGDQLMPGQYALSTSNRNFEGRQGVGGRTFLASPLTAAASAIAGKITDPRSISTGMLGKQL
jgi:3-isopropylmalate/(R)-2-methylmalate dehydratase large subunit